MLVYQRVHHYIVSPHEIPQPKSLSGIIGSVSQPPPGWGARERCGMGNSTKQTCEYNCGDIYIYIYVYIYYMIYDIYIYIYIIYIYIYMHLFMYAFICVCIYLLPFFKEYIMRLRRKDSEICMYIYIYYTWDVSKNGIHTVTVTHQKIVVCAPETAHGTLALAPRPKHG